MVLTLETGLIRSEIGGVPMSRLTAVVLVILSLLAPAAWPQATSGTVSGTVRDQSGAVIPNADVVIANVETNVAVRAKSTETGFYFVPGVTQGSYRLTIEFAGM